MQVTFQTHLSLLSPSKHTISLAKIQLFITEGIKAAGWEENSKNQSPFLPSTEPVDMINKKLMSMNNAIKI